MTDTIDTTSTVYQQRAESQRLRELYLAYAHAQLGTAVDPHAHVHQMNDGAFVSVTIWVPREVIDKPATVEQVAETASVQLV